MEACPRVFGLDVEVETTSGDHFYDWLNWLGCNTIVLYEITYLKSKTNETLQFSKNDFERSFVGDLVTMFRSSIFLNFFFKHKSSLFLLSLF